MTIFVPTLNNEKTIPSLFESIKPLNAKIILIDFGSSDQTIKIAERNGKVLRFYNENDRSYALNTIIGQFESDWNLLIYPWESLIQGHDLIQKAKYNSYISILQNSMLMKSIRLWKKKEAVFINPTFEYIEANTNHELNVYIQSEGRNDFDYNIDLINKWKEKNPRAHEPYYYHACCLLAKGMYQDFLKISEYYMFLDNRDIMSTVMNRYYFSMVSLQVNKKVKPVLQNINMCLCSKPLMAEFWCLIGDTYYHLLKNFSMAKEFYKNAIILGSRRLKEDKWPMDISKYKEYPEKMINSCDQIIDNRKLYG